MVPCAEPTGAGKRAAGMRLRRGTWPLLDLELGRCPNRFRKSGASVPVKLERFVDQEQIRQQRAQVDRCIQVVDELRSDGRLREHEPDGRAGVPRVALDDFDKRAIGRRVESCPLGRRR